MTISPSPNPVPVVHFDIGRMERVACGTFWNRNKFPRLLVALLAKNVTCARCKKTKAYREATDHLSQPGKMVGEDSHE